MGDGEGFYVPHLLGMAHALLGDEALLDRAAEMMAVSSREQCLTELEDEDVSVEMPPDQGEPTEGGPEEDPGTTEPGTTLVP